MKNGRKRIQLLAVILVVSLVFWWPRITFAGSLTEVSVLASDQRPQVSTTHTIDFKVGTTDTIKQIKFQYQKTVGDATKPTSLDLSSAAKGAFTGLTAANWTLDLSAASSGIVKITHNDGEAKTALDQITLEFTAITNPAIGECSTSNKMYDNCYLAVTTYSDFGTTSIDTGNANLYLEQVASLEFTVSGVASGTLTNGITTNIATTYNSIAYDHLGIGVPKYGAHKLWVTSTAANGYVVQMKLDGYIQGLYPANKIDPFAAVDAAWTSPQLWSSPTGTAANTDTGWVGANTSDTRVANWESASGKFGPVSSTRHTVMNATGPDTGSNIYVTYAVEVNALQPPDIYSGTIIYDITATY